MAMTPGSTSLAEGSWGGEQVALTVGKEKAVLRLGCAGGEFAAPIRLDDQGRFSLSGVFTAFGGGPSTASERPAEARFDGVVENGRLRLTVRHGASIENYQLTHGVQAKVIRCL